MGRRTRTRRRAEGILVGIVAMALFAGGVWALVFARNSSISVTVDQSARLVHLDSVLTNALIVQERLERVLILGAAVEGGAADRSTVLALRDDLRHRLEDLGTESPPEVAPLASSYRESAWDLIGSVEVGDLESARRAAFGDLTARHRRLVDALNAERGDAWAKIQEAGSLAGVLATGAGFMVVLLLPAAVIMAYRRVVGQRYREAAAEARRNADRAFLQSRDEFIAGVSHELRTPLTGIYGLAKVLGERYRLDPVLEDELVEMLASQATELTRMVDDIIASARGAAGSLTFAVGTVSVPAEIREVLADVRAGQKQVRVALEDPETPVLADPIRLRQVLVNLLSNAHKHGGPGIHVIGGRVADRYRIEVVDDGPGVADERLSRLFHRFANEGGSALTAGSVGLGLSVARSLVWGMGGDIWYRRSQGRTHFGVELPVAGGAASSPSSVEESVGA